MKRRLPTGDLVIIELLAHYIYGEFPRDRPGPAKEVALSPDARSEYSSLAEPNELCALFGLPPAGEILHRNVWLYEAAKQIGKVKSTYDRIRRLAGYIAAFKRERLPDWLRDLRKAGEPPGMIPPSARSIWIDQLLVGTQRYEIPELLEHLPRAYLSYDVNFYLYFAFANSQKVPTTVPGLYPIIDQNFDGLAGALKLHLYKQIRRRQ